MKYDPKTVLLGLCFEYENEHNQYAAFLDWFVIRHSKKRVLVLGPEEHRVERGVSCIATVSNLDARIMAHADATIMAELRRQEPDPARRDRLRLIHTTCTGSSPGKTWPMKKVGNSFVHYCVSCC